MCSWPFWLKCSCFKTSVVWLSLCAGSLSFATFLNGRAKASAAAKGLKKKQLEALVEKDERDSRKERNDKRNRHGRGDGF